MNIRLLKYLLFNKKTAALARHLFQKKHFFSFVKSLFFSPAITFKNNCYKFNVNDLSDVKKIFLGFSYCQKPNLCPSKKFSDKCDFSIDSSICKNCPVGQFKQSRSGHIEPFFLTDSFTLADFLFSAIKDHPIESTLFIIQACPYAIDNFKNFLHLFKIKLLAFPITGSTCSDFRTFIKAEKGEKKGRTYLDDEGKAAISKVITSIAGPWKRV